MKFKPLAFGLLLAGGAAHADGIPIEPGLWEMTSTINMPMMPQPQTNTVSECVEESEISMDDMGTEGLEGECDFQLQQLDGSTMQWTVDCPMEEGTSHGEWTATSHGDSVTGEGKLSMTVMGQSMDMTMTWEGKRIGACGS
mgnify:CR=1 FL=1